MAPGGEAGGRTVNTVTIERIAAGGDGIAHLENGMAVFVPRTAPGDRVDIELLETRKRFARARVRAVVAASPHRVEPPCLHYTSDHCGGCQLQHLDAGTQRAIKSRIAGDALRRIGRLDLPDPPVRAAAEQWRYRRKITMHASGGRIGLRPSGSATNVFDLDDCRITDERLMQLWRDIRAHARHLPPSLERLLLRADRDERLHVIAATSDATPWDWASLATAVARDASYWWWPRDGAPRVVQGPHTGYPALAFEQVYPAVAAQVRNVAVELLEDVTGLVVWDLYGGVGETAELVAARGARVWSVDSDRSAVAWGRHHFASTVTRVAGKVEDVLPRLPAPDAIVVNPPRVGLGTPVTDWIQRWGSTSGRRVIYVSCDPATLARDLSRLTAFDANVIEGFDLFPQTSHLELVVRAQSR